MCRLLQHYDSGHEILIPFNNPSFTFGGEGFEPTPKGFSLITFERNELETPNFTNPNIYNVYIYRGMIKFKIYPKLLERERCKFGKVLQNVKRFFDIFSDILDKMKDNLGQECAKGASILSGQNWNICPCFP